MVPTPRIQCPSCAHAVAAENRFCPNCGRPLESLSQIPTQEPLGSPPSPPPASPNVGRLVSSDSIPVGGFTPGAILADRYRIIGLLGRGGMGEVYRADDLKLGQPVALKFLPPALASDPVRRERFFAEVRITRSLSHPNICRMYDITEFQGQHFLTMEFIDGEDLASLLKRIGYLSNEKALDIARQLAAGLAAAHDRGVLHRDLKPANIMIDGHGRVRITDFGIAIAAGEDEAATSTLGTPAYMAPEQFHGQAATVRSDIYSLGLILYEIYCGKRAFTATTLPELRAHKEGHTPTAPSEIREGLDPIVERIILRCMERDPRSRPASVAQLAAALPGGDPLAAALAAGETPSPEMVAASGLKEGLRPAVAFGLFAFLVAGTIAILLMGEQAMLYRRVSLTKPPDALVAQAREFIKKAGYPDAAVDSASGFQVDTDLQSYYLDSAEKTDPKWEKMLSFSSFRFWYRQSPHPLERSFFNTVSYTFNAGHRPGVISTDPPAQYSGEVSVLLDGEGQLRKFEAIPPLEAAADAGAPPDWSVPLSAAGLDLSRWTPVTPRWNPLHYADQQAAWEGSIPELPGMPLRVEAAAYHGKLVSFELIAPWTRASRIPVDLPGIVSFAAGLGIVLLSFVAAGGLFFAHRNLRLGRGDRRGATRMVLFVISLKAASWLLAEHHVNTIWQLELVVEFVSSTLFTGAFLWILYIALEPFVRRRWPQILVSWARLVSGDWRDPLVGRDVLIGYGVAITTVCLLALGRNIPQWLDRSQATLPLTTGAFRVLGAGSFVSVLVDALSWGIISTLAILFLFFLLWTVLRSQWAAAIAIVAITSLPDVVSSPDPWIFAPLILVANSLFTLTMIRFGLVAMFVNQFVTIIFLQFPMSLSSEWYSGIGYAALLVLAALAIYGLRVSLGDRPLLNLARLED